VGFYKDNEGVVHLKGRVINGGPERHHLPAAAGYRPESGKIIDFPAACECTGAQTTVIAIAGAGFSSIFDGEVSMFNGNLSTGSSLWLNGISFLAAS
jgi:hypothetical protein